MRRLLLFILICWPLLFSGTICNVVVGGVAAPAGLTCTHGSGDSAITSYTGHTDGTSMFYSTRWKGIPFTISASTRITSVKLWIANETGTSKNAIVRIETLSSSLPSNTLADANATKTVSIPAAFGTEYEFIFDTPFTLSTGTYVVVIRGDVVDSGPITYTDTTTGTFYTTIDSGTNWTANSGYRGYLIVEGCQ